MPNKFFPNKLKSWWQQRFKQDTLDWRSLSPHHPPLPFLLSNTVDEPLNDSTPIQHHSNIILDSISNIHPSKVSLLHPLSLISPFCTPYEYKVRIAQERNELKNNLSNNSCIPNRLKINHSIHYFQFSKKVKRSSQKKLDKKQHNVNHQRPQVLVHQSLQT
jgi:hypothetical protein